MAADLYIPFLAAAVVTLIYTFERPGDAAKQKIWTRQLIRLLRAVLRVSIRLLALRQADHRRWFFIGAVASAAVSAFLNFVPHGGAVSHPVRSFGFPFTFLTEGDWSGASHFYGATFAADLLFAAIASLISGYAAIGIRTVLRSGGKPESARPERDQTGEHAAEQY